MGYEDILSFWFDSDNMPFWFTKSNDFDSLIKRKFKNTWLSASKGELFDWRKCVEGRLAEIIILDQFSRNLNRGHPASFEQDGMALILSQELLSTSGWDKMTSMEKAVSLLPWMHSESQKIHNVAKEIFSLLPEPDFLKFEIKHSEIIDTFGRYPFRNSILGRTSTKEEIEWMKENQDF